MCTSCVCGCVDEPGPWRCFARGQRIVPAQQPAHRAQHANQPFGDLPKGLGPNDRLHEPEDLLVLGDERVLEGRQLGSRLERRTHQDEFVEHCQPRPEPFIGGEHQTSFL